MLYDVSIIKNRITCVEYAKHIGLPISNAGDRCVSPLREGAKNKTSFVVFDDFFMDFADTGGDVIEFCARYAHNGDRGAAIRELAQLTGVAPLENDNTGNWMDYTRNRNAQTAYYHAQLLPSDFEYLHSRGLKDEDINRLMIGRVSDGPLKGRLFLPYFNSGYVCYYATRAMPGGAYPENKYMKQKKDSFCQHVPWGLQTLNRNKNILIIAEGYFDAVSFEIEGYPVLSAITGSFSKSQISTVLSCAKMFEKTLIVYDNDPETHAGEHFTKRMAEIFLKSHIPFVVGTVPAPYHDISDYYAANGPGSLQPIVAAAQDGLQYIVGTFTDFQDLERFCYSISRHIKRTALDELFSTITRLERFNDRAIKTLYKSCTTAPPENIVADEIIAAHQLIFLHGVGFYEYEHGVWNRRIDGQIRRYADAAYGEFSTAQRVIAVTKLVADRTLNNNVSFNTKPLWNFVNGTLELDTGVFREASPNDYCSIQTAYPYDPEATCPNWENFIATIMDHRPVEMEILQFIPGYVLFQDCPHEKIFVLTGGGSNGKSRYTMMLEQLFGPDNVTNLVPRDFTQKFDLIRLRDSVLNIAGEIKSNLATCEEPLKMAASGERLSACYKGKDVIQFTPRAKLLFATNGQLSSGDTSDGLARRLIIVDFPMRFVNNPSQPNELPMDINLMDKLLPELPGIFNWAYAGYKLLKTVGYFTETANQKQLLQEFRRASNNVLQFWEETFVDADNYPPELSNQQLYSDYRTWCVGAGETALNNIQFGIEFKKVSSDRYEKFEKSVRKNGKPVKLKGYLQIL